MTFDDAFTALVGNEGSYSNDSRDPGNWTSGIVGSGVLKGTKYGIAAASYPGEDIVNLTLDRAKAIYRTQYWGPAGCDVWPDGIKFEVFDIAVNTGVKTAITLLQRAVGAVEDGVIGPQTTMRVQSADPQWVRRLLTAKRLRYYTALKTFPVFGAGWVNRIAGNLEKA